MGNREGKLHFEEIGCSCCLPANPLVFSTLDCVKNMALVFFQFPLLSRNALVAFSLALKIYFASSKFTIMVGSVSVESVV